MFDPVLKKTLQEELEGLKKSKLLRKELYLNTPQGPRVEVVGRGKVLNFCANNYLGAASHPEVVRVAKEFLDRWGYGMASSRLICGTQAIHKELETAFATFLEQEDVLFYVACFDANGGLFEPLLDERDAIISDALNHASIIDGIRLCKADRYRYKHSDMNDLEENLKKASKARYRLIATDGVFSMDGDIANLPAICDLAEKYNALVMVDDSHATGYIGPTGRGTPELYGLADRVDLLTTTLGKALGGALGGCTAGKKELIGWLRQRSRPYLFSNNLPPAVVGATLKILQLMVDQPQWREAIYANAAYFKESLTSMGFTLKKSQTAIVPVMLYDEVLAVRMGQTLLEEGILAVAFAYPVVPKNQARIRVQLSAAHTREDLDRALEIFERVGKRLGILSSSA